MMKFLLTTIILFAALTLSAQTTKSPFQAGYIRLGINSLGKDLDPALSPKDNVFAGRYGASTGYVFEFGHIYSFNKKTAAANRINYGLDWTILSLNYNKMDKWGAYGNASNANEVFTDGTKIAAAISSKLGPSISFNPVEKLVIDARFQIVPVFRFFDIEYNDGNTADEMRSFSFEGESDKITDRISFGVATDLGITVRRGALGLSMDYITGKVNSNYSYYEGDDNYISGKEKIPVSNLQFKLNFSF